MTDVLTVPTHFGDISELSTGLADRVDEERLILYGPTAYEEGATVGFSVLLVDGSPALEGIGRVTAAVDGGEERAPETRFDIVFDSLQLEGMSEVVYERIVMARMSMVGDEPATGEVDVSELEDEVAEAEAAPAEDEAHEQHSADWEGDAETAVADPEQIAALADETADHGAVGFDDGVQTVVADVSELDGSPDDDGMGDLAAAVDLAADVDMAAAADDSVGDVQEADDVVDFAADVDMGDVADVDMGEVSDVDAGDAVADAGDAYDDSFEDSYDDEPQSSPPASVRDSLGPPPEDPPIAPSPELPPAPAGFQIPPSEGRLVRPTFPPTWHPMASEPPEPTESTGFFLYQPNDLPVPAMAPRPDIDPSLRVQPAPSPDAAAAAGANEPAPESQGDTGDEPPQIPLPDDDSDVAPAVEPDSFALGDEVSIQEPDDDEAMDVSDDDAMAMDADVEPMADDDEPPPPPPEALADDGMDDFDGEIAVDGGLDGDDIAFEEDDRV